MMAYSIGWIAYVLFGFFVAVSIKSKSPTGYSEITAALFLIAAAIAFH